MEQSWQANLLELESKLARSKAQWKIVIGHHPVYSNGHHNSTAELVQHVQPLLQVSHISKHCWCFAVLCCAVLCCGSPPTGHAHPCLFCSSWTHTYEADSSMCSSVSTVSP